MLALAYAATHPTSVAAVVLVGCGTFDRHSRERVQSNRELRMSDAQRARYLSLERSAAGSDSRLRKLRDLLLPVDSVDLIEGPHELGDVDARAHDETWADMLRLQDDGTFPAAFSQIEVPVLMLHGSHDPHPGPLIRASLAAHVRRLEYVSLPRCGHYPWFERAGRDEFFNIPSSGLSRRLAAPAGWGPIVTSVSASDSRAVPGATAEP
jgi:pimeloyl-ACP methyl ester carboxylesterase